MVSQSVCSNYITGNKYLFKSTTNYDGGVIQFGDDSKESYWYRFNYFNEYCDITNVVIKGLMFNLLRISQLYDTNLEVYFKKNGCTIKILVGWLYYLEVEKKYLHYRLYKEIKRAYIFCIYLLRSLDLAQKVWTCQHVSYRKTG